jgi:hypothetical protein
VWADTARIILNTLTTEPISFFKVHSYDVTQGHDGSQEGAEYKQSRPRVPTGQIANRQKRRSLDTSFHTAHYVFFLHNLLQVET